MKKVSKENIRNAKPISLYPLKPEEALRRAMNVSPSELKQERGKGKRKS